METFSSRIQKIAVRTISRSPKWLMRLVAGPPVVIDGQTLDLQVQYVIKLVGAKEGALPSVEESRREADEQGGWLSHPASAEVISSPLQFSGPNGPIEARAYRPKQLTVPAPVLVFYHGGGHVAGSLQSHDLPCRRLALKAECIVIAVDYRLAPEHRFPAGVNDGVAAFREIVNRAKELDIDPRRVAVGGDSAGGNLAAVVAQQTRDDEYPPCYQLLWVPWLDMSSQRRSYELFPLGFFLEKPKMEWYTDLYLNAPSDALDPRASPILGDVKGVAPAAILVAGFDPLRDEGEEYARLLEKAGVPVVLKRYSGLVHPFINVAGCIGAASDAFDDAIRLLRAALS
ncbi:alpha/beta hydrolase [Phyllobacterium endophyticum]|nr:alpha/beta hydrolase [Phyllobacterium endophyticum]MBB3233279.1 acetyl esterase [Phyllobacterium endophyticum]TYR43295.1 alpha/beta hydrolase [Phyllobacterium endophyticum]